MSTAVFTLIFIATGALVLFYLPMYHLSNIWRVDGLTQHFASLVYFNRLVRGFVAHPSGGVPLWSWEFGLGADNLSSLAHYVIGDPFVLISFLMPMRRIELAYELMYFARLLFAGIFGFWYLRRMGAVSAAATAGSIIYVFSSFALLGGMRHPFFVNAMVFLPLILIGIEKIFAGQRPYLLVGAVFLAATTNFYFFYMIGLISVVYCVVRFIDITPKESWLKALPKALLHIAVPYAIGTALAALVLVPVLTAVFGTARAAGSGPVPAFYKLAEYGGYVTGFVSAWTAPNSGYLGYSVLVLVLLPVSLMRLRKNLTMRVMAVLFAIFLAFPLFGWIFNGFTFASNRYLFAWGLFLGGAVALVLSDSQPLTRKELVVAFSSLLIFSATAVYASPRRAVLLPLLIGGLVIVLLAVEGLGRWNQPLVRIGPRMFAEEWAFSPARWAIVGLLVINVATNGMFHYDARYSKDLVANWVKSGTALERYQANGGSLARELPKGDFYRVEKQRYVDRSYVRPVSSNDSIVQGYYGTSYYISLMPEPMTNFLDEIQNRSNRMSFAFAGFDDRATLLSLLGVKYYIADKYTSEFVPYGFIPLKQSGRSTVYRNLNALPLGFVYKNTISKGEWDAMMPLEKQQALLRGAVVDDDTATVLPSASRPTEISQVPYHASDTTGAVLVKGLRDELQLGKKPRVLTLAFPPQKDTELYVELYDFDYRVKPKKVKPVSKGTPALVRDLMAIRKREVAEKIPGRLFITYRADGGVAKTERWDTPAAVNRYVDNTQLVNMGYRRQPTSTVRINPDHPGTIDFTQLSVYSVRMDQMRSQIAELARGGLTNVKLGTNSVAGHVDSPYRGILFLSIPYSSGWTAKVDGRDTPVMRVNTAFSGLLVEPGAHTVQLHYMTPGLKTGLLISGVALVALGGLVYFQEHSRRVKRSSLSARTWWASRRGA